MLLKKKLIVLHKPDVVVAKNGTGMVSEDSPVQLPKLKEFQMIIATNVPKHHWGIIREWSEKLFGEFPNPDVHHQMLMLRIQYELVRLDYVEQKLSIPPRLAQNIEASKHYNVEKLVPSLRDIMESLTKGENMATTKKAAIKTNNKAVVKVPAPRPIVKGKETVAQSYVRLFQENFTKKLTDIQLAGEMIKLHPDKKKYTVEDIDQVRKMFNRGIRGFAKPEIALMEVPNASSKNKK